MRKKYASPTPSVIAEAVELMAKSRREEAVAKKIADEQRGRLLAWRQQGINLPLEGPHHKIVFHAKHRKAQPERDELWVRVVKKTPGRIARTKSAGVARG